MMNRIVIILVFLFILFHPVLSYADESWVIENFNSNLAIQQSGVVDVTETISVDFRNTPQYGIYRDIPYEYEANGKEFYTKITVNKVLQNNIPAKYTTEENNGSELISIGDPDNPLTGRNVYTILYSVTGILQQRVNYDTLYWDVTGFNWPVAIEKAEANVTMPDKGIISIACSEGATGSMSSCRSNNESLQEGLFSVIKPLSASEGLTVTVNFEKGLVPILSAHPPLSYVQILLQWPEIIVSVIIILFGIFVYWYVWYKYTDDFWAIIRIFDRKSKNKTGRQYALKVEFSAPDNLSPAEIGVLLKGCAESGFIAATLISLASRGFLQITEIPKPWRFGTIDYLFTKKNQTEKKMVHIYEQLLFNTLFYRRSKVKLSNIQAPFYRDIVKIKNALYHAVIVKKLFPFDPEKNRKKYRALAYLFGFFGFCMLYVGLTSHAIPAGEFGIGLIIDSILFISLYRYIPIRTPRGTHLYWRSLGFKQFIQEPERYKQGVMKNEEIFTKMVPYAMIFGSTEKFGKKMGELAPYQNTRDWFTGISSETTADFAWRLSNFSDMMSTTISANSMNGLANPEEPLLSDLQSKNRLKKRSKSNNYL